MSSTIPPSFSLIGPAISKSISDTQQEFSSLPKARFARLGSINYEYTYLQADLIQAQFLLAGALAAEDDLVLASVAHAAVLKIGCLYDVINATSNLCNGY